MGFYPEVFCPLTATLTTSPAHSEIVDRGDGTLSHQAIAGRAALDRIPTSSALPSIRINDCDGRILQNTSILTCDTFPPFARATTPSELQATVPKLSHSAFVGPDATQLAESLKVLINSAARSDVAKLHANTESMQQALSAISPEVTIDMHKNHAAKRSDELSPQQQWLLNARAAGIAVTLP